MILYYVIYHNLSPVQNKKLTVELKTNHQDLSSSVKLISMFSHIQIYITVANFYINYDYANYYLWAIAWSSDQLSSVESWYLQINSSCSAVEMWQCFIVTSLSVNNNFVLTCVLRSFTNLPPTKLSVKWKRSVVTTH